MSEFIWPWSWKAYISRTKYKKMVKKMKDSYEKADKIALKSRIVADSEAKQAEDELADKLNEI